MIATGDKRSFARLSEAHLSDIASSLRTRSCHGDSTAAAIADAVESVIRVRCDANEIYQRTPAVRVRRALNRVVRWAAPRVAPFC